MSVQIVMPLGLVMASWVALAGCASAAVVPELSPQRPPYRIGAVSVQVEGVTLDATMTVPEGAGPFSAVILVGRDRDDALKEWPGFEALADTLTRAGLVVVRPARVVTRVAEVHALAVRLADVPTIARAQIGAFGFGASAALALEAQRGAASPITFVVAVPAMDAPIAGARVFTAPRRYTPAVVTDLVAWIRALVPPGLS